MLSTKATELYNRHAATMGGLCRGNGTFFYNNVNYTGGDKTNSLSSFGSQTHGTCKKQSGHRIMGVTDNDPKLRLFLLYPAVSYAPCLYRLRKPTSPALSIGCGVDAAFPGADSDGSSMVARFGLSQQWRRSSRGSETTGGASWGEE